MIILDTNVISEAMKPEPHASVGAWLTVMRVAGTPNDETYLEGESGGLRAH